ncbi:MAG: cytochrome c3 family protein [Desulfuromonadales bacterium]|jgi:hypothetical protein
MQTSAKRLTKMTLLAAAVLLAALPAAAREVPDVVEIAPLAQYYEPVVFDHSMHIEVAEDCSSCHHQTTGTPMLDENCGRCHHAPRTSGAAACAACHAIEPFSAETLRAKEMDNRLYHRDKPGLKAAYHQNCLGCHAEMGGPTGCQDCHGRTEAGDALFNAGAYAPNPAAAAGHH